MRPLVWGKTVIIILQRTHYRDIWFGFSWNDFRFLLKTLRIIVYKRLSAQQVALRAA
jgi:hypothetical protein